MKKIELVTQKFIGCNPDKMDIDHLLRDSPIYIDKIKWIRIDGKYQYKQVGTSPWVSKSKYEENKLENLFDPTQAISWDKLHFKRMTEAELFSILL